MAAAAPGNVDAAGGGRHEHLGRRPPGDRITREDLAAALAGAAGPALEGLDRARLHLREVLYLEPYLGRIPLDEPSTWQVQAMFDALDHIPSPSRHRLAPATLAG